jgi:hypothetical protein
MLSPVIMIVSSRSLTVGEPCDQLVRDSYEAGSLASHNHEIIHSSPFRDVIIDRANISQRLYNSHPVSD